MARDSDYENALQHEFAAALYDNDHYVAVDRPNPTQNAPRPISAQEQYDYPDYEYTLQEEELPSIEQYASPYYGNTTVLESGTAAAGDQFLGKLEQMRAEQSEKLRTLSTMYHTMHDNTRYSFRRPLSRNHTLNSMHSLHMSHSANLSRSIVEMENEEEHMADDEALVYTYGSDQLW